MVELVYLSKLEFSKVSSQKITNVLLERKPCFEGKLQAKYHFSTTNPGEVSDHELSHQEALNVLEDSGVERA